MGKFLQLHEHNRYDPVHDEIHERLSTRRSIADQIWGNAGNVVMEISLPEICLVLRHKPRPTVLVYAVTGTVHAWKRLTRISNGANDIASKFSESCLFFPPLNPPIPFRGQTDPTSFT